MAAMMKAAMVLGLAGLMACGSISQGPDNADNKSKRQSGDWVCGHMVSAMTRDKDPIYEALIRAGAAGDGARVSEILSQGIDPNELTSGGSQSLFTFAAYCFDRPIVEIFLQHGGQIVLEDGSPDKGALQSALERGVETGDWENFEWLYPKADNIEFRASANQFTLAETAVVLGQDRIANRLMDDGYDRDLDVLLYHARNRPVTPNSEASREKAKLIARLEKRVQE